MTQEDMVVLIQNYVDADGVLRGVEDLARLIRSELTKENTKGYFRAMSDIASGAVEQMNNR
jgi:hypothetical protein